MTTEKQKQAEQQTESSLPIISLILGVVSLTGPGLILGIPAIVTASIALKRKQPNRHLSIAGLVTGIVSTVVSVLILTLIGIAIIWSLNHPEIFTDPYYYPQIPEHYLEHTPSGSHT